MLGIALMWTTYGKVYNEITDDDTHDDILNLSIVYLLWCWGLVVGRVAARVLPGVSRASLCTLDHALQTSSSFVRWLLLA